MRLVLLEEVSSIYSGNPAPKEKHFLDEGEGIPFIRAGHLEDLILGEDVTKLPKISLAWGEENRYRLIKKGTVLFAKSGMSATKNRVYMLEEQFSYFVSHLAAVVPNEKYLNPTYLKYFLNYFKPSRLIQDESYPSIKISDISKIPIPLPPLEEQKRIAEILDRAQRLISLNDQMLKMVDELEASLFSKTFIETGSKGKVSDAVKELKAGWSTGGEDRKKSPDEYGVLTTSAVTTGIFDSTKYKSTGLSIHEKHRRIVTVKKNDVLISRMNTRELVGASAIVDADYPDLFIPDRLWKAILDHEICHPIYFVKAIQSVKFRKIISQHSTGTSGSMLNISKSKFMNLPFYVPPISLQLEFASRIEHIGGFKKQLIHRRMLMDYNYNSLLQRAFKGELSKQPVG